MTQFKLLHKAVLQNSFTSQMNPFHKPINQESVFDEISLSWAISWDWIQQQGSANLKHSGLGRTVVSVPNIRNAKSGTVNDRNSGSAPLSLHKPCTRQLTAPPLLEGHFISLVYQDSQTPAIVSTYIPHNGNTERMKRWSKENALGDFKGRLGEAYIHLHLTGWNSPGYLERLENVIFTSGSHAHTEKFHYHRRMKERILRDNLPQMGIYNFQPKQLTQILWLHNRCFFNDCIFKKGVREL